MNVIRRIMRTFARQSVRNSAAPQQLEQAPLRSACTSFASENVPEPARIASEALCFFHTENFDNSQEKMEKRRRSSLGVDIIGPVPLTSYKGVSCSSNLFSGSRRPSVD